MLAIAVTVTQRVCYLHILAKPSTHAFTDLEFDDNLHLHGNNISK